MTRLLVGNSSCQLSGLPVDHDKALRGVLSYHIPFYGVFQVTIAEAHRLRQGNKRVLFLDAEGKLQPLLGKHSDLKACKASLRKKPASCKGHWFKVRQMMTRRGDFPTGLLYLVENYLKKHQLKHAKNDTRKRPNALQGFPRLRLPFDPYPEQAEAAVAAAEAGRGIVVAPTGVGKSAIAALIIDQLKVNTLVVVPTLELKRQLTTALKEAFGDENVGQLSQKRPLAVENVDALDFRKPLEGYDCVLIDEFHHAGALTYRKLNAKAWPGVYHRIGMTATPFRSQDHERLLLEGVLSQVVYEIDYPTAVKKGYIVPLEAYYVDVPETEIKGSAWPTVYKQLVVNNKARNDIIIRLLIKLHRAEASTLCLVKEVSHGHTIAEDAFTFVKGDNADNREMIADFNARKIKVLVGTTGIIGEGVDTKPCEYVILAGLGKSKNALMQAWGRVFRRYKGKTSGKVIIFRDASHKFGLTHFAAQVRVLKEEYGIKPVRLEV